MSISIDQQVAQLAAEGHQEIAVIRLPSQATRKRRKPRASTKPAYVPPAPSYPTPPSPVKARQR
jgi:hypothetical protein